MKAVLASVLFACAIFGPAAHADISVGVYADIPGQPIDSVDEFYGELQPYGSWVQDPQLGYVFIPSEEGYVPYTNGHWEYTDIGLVWVSDEPFAWATSHYGRWFFDDAYGRWAWMPDTEWGPAWVQWSNYGDDYGWAPLPPRGYEAPIIAWHYAPASRLFDPDLHRYYEPRQRVVNIHRYARSVPQYRQFENRQIVAGPPVAALQEHHVNVQPRRLEPRQIGRFAPGQRPRPQPKVQARSPRDFQNRQPRTFEPTRPPVQGGVRTVEPAQRPQIQPAPRAVEPAQRPQIQQQPRAQRVEPQQVQRPQLPRTTPPVQGGVRTIEPAQRPQPAPRAVEPAQRPQIQRTPPQPAPAPRSEAQPRRAPPMRVAPQPQPRPAPQAAQHAAPQAQQHAAPQAPPAQQHAAPPAQRAQPSSDRRGDDRH